MQAERALRAAEHEAAAFDVAKQRAVELDDVGWVLEGCAHGVRSLAMLQDRLGSTAGGAHGHVLACDPVHDVDPMNKQIGHGAAAEIPIPTPVRELIRVKFAIRGGTEEEFPVELGSVNARTFRRMQKVVLIPVSADKRNLSDL